jgi:hypothetical protein
MLVQLKTMVNDCSGEDQSMLVQLKTMVNDCSAED